MAQIKHKIFQSIFLPIMSKVTWTDVVNKNYLVIYDKVYDVSGFKNRHPGGEFVFDDWYGKDATDIFESVGHSNYAKEMMNEFYVGDLDKESVRPSHKSSSIFLYSFLVGLVSIACAFIYIWCK